MDTIPARRGKATYLRQGQSIRIINTHGEQVIDTWAFTAGMLTEFMSMEHTRATLTRMRPQTGDGLYTNRRRRILTMTEDTSRGDHDTLMAACDSERYILLGVKEYHDNCTDNLFAAMQALGLTPPECPGPLNLFMNIPWTPAGGLSFDPPTTKRTRSRPGASSSTRRRLGRRRSAPPSCGSCTRTGSTTTGSPCGTPRATSTDGLPEGDGYARPSRGPNAARASASVARACRK